MKLEYDTFELENGLKVFVQEDLNVRKVAVNVLYKVGARDEQSHRTGMAHLFEHLMFSGSKNIPDYDVHVQKMGGENNAYTNNDITNYYITCPSNQLETAFWLESDRMLEIDLSQKNVDVQKSVVSEEFKQRYLNQPYGDAYLSLRPLVYKVHPYRWMTIGEKLEHIEAVTLDECIQFFQSFYAPNNAILSVAGGVSLDEVKKLAEKWFGGIPSRKINRPERLPEPIQKKSNFEEIYRSVPYSCLYRAYRMPARNHADYYAADLITDILSNGKSSKLYQRLVKDLKLAGRVSCFSWGLYDPGMMSLEARCAENVNIKDLENEIDNILYTLADLVTEEELQMVKNKSKSLFAFDRIPVINKAQNIALSESIGNADLINDSIDLYMNVTIDELKASVKNLISPEKASTLYYIAK